METYVFRFVCDLEILVRVEVGGQVKLACGGSAYEVIKREVETCSTVRAEASRS